MRHQRRRGARQRRPRPRQWRREGWGRRRQRQAARRRQVCEGRGRRLRHGGGGCARGGSGGRAVRGGRPVGEGADRLVRGTGEVAEAAQLGHVAGAQRRDREGGRHLPGRQVVGDVRGHGLAVERGVPQHQAGELVEGVGPHVVGDAVGVEELLEPVAGLGVVPRRDERAHGVELAAVAPRPGRAEGDRQRPHADGRRRPDAPLGRRGRRLHDRRRGLVGAEHGEPEVPGVPLRVAAPRGLGQRGVRPPHGRRARHLQRRRPVERVAELDAAAPPGDQPRLLGRAEVVHVQTAHPQCGRGDAGRRRARRRDDGQRAAGARGQRADEPGERPTGHLLQRQGDRERAGPGERVHGQALGQVAHGQRVAERLVADALDHAGRRRDARPPLDQRSDVGLGEPPQLQGLPGPGDAQLLRRPPREHREDAVGEQAAQREAQRAARRRVGPMRVVDHQQHRGVLGDGGQEREGRGGQEQPVGRRLADAARRRLQHVALLGQQPRGPSPQRPQHVGHHGQRQLGLALDGPGGDGQHTPLRRVLHQPLHEQGLARPGLTLDDEGGGTAVDDPVEGGGERVLDLGAADDVVGRARKDQGHGELLGVRPETTDPRCGRFSPIARMRPAVVRRRRAYGARRGLIRRAGSRDRRPTCSARTAS